MSWDGCFKVSLDDGTECESYDMIWLATGAETHIDNYSVLSQLREVLPVSVANGLPVLSNYLTWRCPKGTDEPTWKQVARKNFYIMGALAGLALGPDSLNLIGARHGSAKVAQCIRRDFEDQRLRMLNAESGEESDCGCC